MKRAVDVIKDIAPSPRAEYITAWDAGDGKLSQAGIDTPLRLAHLIAQCAAECGCFHSLRESSNFTHEDVFIQVFNNIKHSTGLLPGEAKMLLGQEKDVAERFYGVGGPSALYAAHQINHGINPSSRRSHTGSSNEHDPKLCANSFRAVTICSVVSECPRHSARSSGTWCSRNP